MSGRLQPDPRRLTSNLLAFMRGLRRMGFRVGGTDIALALEALTFLPLEDEEAVRDGLRAVLARDPLQMRLFDLAWRQYGYLLVGVRDPRLASQTLLASTARLRARWKEKPQVVWLGGEREDGSVREGRLTVRGGRSAAEIFKGGEWAPLTPDEREEMERLSLGPLWRPGRRRKAGRKGEEWDPSATWRRALRQGESWELMRRRKVRRKERTVWILDVSGSMEPYSRMVLRFLHTLLRKGIPLEAFVISTRVTRITPALQGRDADHALAEAVRAAPDWSGGTRLARGLKSLEAAGRRFLKGAGIMLVTDGLEGEDPTGLEEGVKRLRRWARWLVWLNPAASYPGYRPLARGASILQEVAHAAWPGRTWEDLEEAWRRLRSLRPTF